MIRFSFLSLLALSFTIGCGGSGGEPTVTATDDISAYLDENPDSNDVNAFENVDSETP